MKMRKKTERNTREFVSPNKIFFVDFTFDLWSIFVKLNILWITYVIIHSVQDLLLLRVLLLFLNMFDLRPPFTICQYISSKM